MIDVRIEGPRPSRREHLRVAEVLAEALSSDPGWTQTVANPVQRLDALRTLMHVAVRAAGSNGRVAWVGEEIVGAALWPSPGTYPWGFGQNLRAASSLFGLALRLRHRIRPVIALGSAIDSVFPDEPVRYLQVLGVSTARQRQGIGSALLTDGLKHADARREAVYLETSAAHNVSIYANRGFAVLDGSPSPLALNGPVMWRMQRDANVAA